MRRTRGFEADRLVALVVAVIVHAALVGGWWHRSLGATPSSHDADAALQVVWIERPRTNLPQPVPVATPPPPGEETRKSATRATTAMPRIAEPSPAPSTDPPTPSRPLSAVFIEQGRALAGEQARSDFLRNPLTDGPARRIDVAPERIRMGESITPATVVARVGLLFGGAGYETSPCPRIRRNIERFKTEGADSSALQEELRRLQQSCMR